MPATADIMSIRSLPDDVGFPALINDLDRFAAEERARCKRAGAWLAGTAAPLLLLVWLLAG